MTTIAVYAPNETAEAVVLATLGPELDRLRPSLVAHGDARNVESAVYEWSTRSLVTVVKFRADWARWGSQLCGTKRDENAAAWAQIVVAVHDRHARASYGLVREAIRRGRRVVLLAIGSDGELVDRVDTGEGATVDRVISLIDAERVRRPRRPRAPKVAA